MIDDAVIFYFYTASLYILLTGARCAKHKKRKNKKRVTLWACILWGMWRTLHFLSSIIGLKPPILWYYAAYSKLTNQNTIEVQMASCTKLTHVTFSPVIYNCQHLAVWCQMRKKVKRKWQVEALNRLVLTSDPKSHMVFIPCHGIFHHTLWHHHRIE